MAYRNIRRLLAGVVVGAYCASKLAIAQPNNHPVFEVFFDSGSSTLKSSQLKQVVAAASSIQTLVPQQVLVVGYADSVGTEADNLALSRRRAEHVFQRLKAQGVPASIVSLDWKGEFEQSLPTQGETPERKNRRVTITLNE